MQNLCLNNEFLRILRWSVIRNNKTKYQKNQIPNFTFKGCKIGHISYKALIINVYCGETGIRTPGTSRYNGFQDRRNRPLCHLSKTSSQKCFLLKSLQRYVFILNMQDFWIRKIKGFIIFALSTEKSIWN